jgi:hypothetical protein
MSSPLIVPVALPGGLDLARAPSRLLVLLGHTAAKDLCSLELFGTFCVGTHQLITSSDDVPSRHYGHGEGRL